MMSRGKFSKPVSLAPTTFGPVSGRRKRRPSYTKILGSIDIRQRIRLETDRRFKFQEPEPSVLLSPPTIARLLPYNEGMTDEQGVRLAKKFGMSGKSRKEGRAGIAKTDGTILSYRITP
jgi:hypothetical protein